VNVAGFSLSNPEKKFPEYLPNLLCSQNPVFHSDAIFDKLKSEVAEKSA
jgi:hypothetical protein